MAFGTADRLKWDVAEGAALVLGRLAVRRAGRVALMTFGAGRPRLVPPRASKPGVVALRRALAEGCAPDGRPDRHALADALRRTGKVATQAGPRRADLRLPRPGRLDAAARRAARAPLGAGDRGRRPARGVDPRGRAAVARRPRDGRARRGRHLAPAGARALRRARGRAPRAGRARAAAARGRARDALDRAATGCKSWGDASDDASRRPCSCSRCCSCRSRSRRRSRRGGARADTRSASPPRRRSRSPPGARRRGGAALPIALLLASIAALALALAKPQRTVAVPVERASIMLVTDHSRSMMAEDVDPTRLAAAKRAAQTFLDQLPHGVRVGVTTFSDVPDGTQAPTRDHVLVRRMVDAQIADGGTATGDALQVALDTLEREPRGADGRRPPSAIVLLSDGTTTTGRDPVGVARTGARAEDPRLHGRARHARRDRAEPRLRPAAAVGPARPRDAEAASPRPPAAAASRPRTTSSCPRSTRRSAPSSARATSSARSPPPSPSAASSCCSAPPPRRRGGPGDCPERSRQVTTAQGSTRELAIRPAAL